MKWDKNTDLRDLTYLEAQDFEESDPEAYGQAVELLNERINSTHAKYAANHRDFDESWKRGEIQKFMRENPGHNPISSHMTLSRHPLRAEDDSALQKTGQHGLTGTIAARLAQRRQGTRQVLREGEVVDADLPPGASPDIIDTMPDQDFQEIVEDPDEPEDINAPVGEGDPVKEE